MRINGYGSGFGKPSDSRDRAAAFRAKHSIGQRINGRILRREQNGLYWVQVGGIELLARLEVQAEPGDQLIFIVRALTPEIMLQALSGGMSAGDVPGLVQRFRAAREVFEVQDSALLETLCDIPPQPDLRHDSFQQALSANPESALRLARVQDLLAQINASLAADQNAVADYQPWLLPMSRRQEMLRTMRSQGGTELNLSAVNPAVGSFESRLIADSDTVRLFLAADLPQACGPLQVEMAAMIRHKFAVEPQMLGPTRLRFNPQGGVLGELFGSVPGWTSGGINTRV